MARGSHDVACWARALLGHEVGVLAGLSRCTHLMMADGTAGFGRQTGLVFKNNVKLGKTRGVSRPEVFLFFPILFFVFPLFFLHPMELTIQQVSRLLSEVSQKCGYPLEYSSFDYIADTIGKGMTKKYLYEKLYLEARDATDKSTRIRLQDNRLNVIARYVGYESIYHFLDGLREDPVLSGLVGSYYCYVRRNSEDTVVFRSPVRISTSGGEYVFELRGPRWVYKGMVTLSRGCVFVLMRSESGKQIHHVYKIGISQGPRVLQGIFSGVSTSFEPIGGRVVLAAVKEPFEKLDGREITLDELRKDKSLGVKLARYFGKYEENNLRIKPVTTFKEDDL